MFYSACRDGCCVCCCQNLKPCMPGSKGAISRSLDNGFDRFSWATCGSSCFSWGCLLAVTWLTNVFFVIYQRFVFQIAIGLPWFHISQSGKWLHHRWWPCGSSWVSWACLHTAMAYKSFICYVLQVWLPYYHCPSLISH